MRTGEQSEAGPKKFKAGLTVGSPRSVAKVVDGTLSQVWCTGSSVPDARWDEVRGLREEDGFGGLELQVGERGEVSRETKYSSLLRKEKALERRPKCGKAQW